MASKESNPGVTNQIMNLIAIVILIFIEFFIVFFLYKLRSQNYEQMVEGTSAICGVCMLVPAFGIFLAISNIMTLKKRAIYGDKHASSVIVGFVLHMIGIFLIFGGGLMFFMVFEGEVGMSLSMGIPFILIAWGWFLCVKEVGGKIPGLIGAGVYSLGKIVFIIGSIMYFSQENIMSDSARDTLLIPIAGTVIALIGLLILIVGGILSIMWMKENKPLIDTEQRAMMQMQQQQLELQRQQLIATHQLQAQLTGGAPPPQIPHAPPQGGTMKICLSCGQQVGIKYVKCPFCAENTSGPGTSSSTPEY